MSADFKFHHSVAGRSEGVKGLIKLRKLGTFGSIFELAVSVRQRAKYFD